MGVRARVGAGVISSVLILASVVGCSVPNEPVAPRSTYGATSSLPSLLKATAPPARFTLPTSGTMLVLGDSWSIGLYANPGYYGYAFQTAKRLGLKLELDAVGATGYIADGAGIGNGGGTYAQRLAKTPKDASLVIVQGSYNDNRNTPTAIQAAQVKTLTAVKAKYPRAAIAVLGPGSADLGHETFARPGMVSLASLDMITRSSAAAMRLNYVSPIGERWFDPAKKATLIKTPAGKGPHPTNLGHQVFTQRLVADLRKFSGS